MKKLVFIGLFSMITNAVHAAEPTQQQLRNCAQKVARLVRVSAQAAGLGKGVAHLGGLNVIDNETLPDGTTLYKLGGGVLAAQDTDGYLSNSGANASVIFREQSCAIVSFELQTGQRSSIQ